MKKILVIGGTRFVGRALVQQLLTDDKLDLCLFNRGQSNTELFPSTRKIHGDRNSDDMKKIAQENWDVVIDCSSYQPIPLNKQLDLMKGKVGKYIYVSTTSHYDFDAANGKPLTEDLPLKKCSPEQALSEDPIYYNEKKAECERVLKTHEWLEQVVFRPGLIIGRHDYTDRLYYWFHRLHHYDPILIPNNGKNKISYSVVTDLARMMHQAIDHSSTYREYNATSFAASFADFYEHACQLMDRKPMLISASVEFTEENKIQQWSDFPLWINGDQFQSNNDRLLTDYKFKTTSIEAACKTLVDYYANDLKWRDHKQGMSRERELELIEKIKL